MKKIQAWVFGRENRYALKIMSVLLASLMTFSVAVAADSFADGGEDPPVSYSFSGVEDPLFTMQQFNDSLDFSFKLSESAVKSGEQLQLSTAFTVSSGAELMVIPANALQVRVKLPENTIVTYKSNDYVKMEMGDEDGPLDPAPAGAEYLWLTWYKDVSVIGDSSAVGIAVQLAPTKNSIVDNGTVIYIPVSVFFNGEESQVKGKTLPLTIEANHFNWSKVATVISDGVSTGQQLTVDVIPDDAGNASIPALTFTYSANATRSTTGTGDVFTESAKITDTFIVPQITDDIPDKGKVAILFKPTDIIIPTDSTLDSYEVDSDGYVTKFTVSMEKSQSAPVLSELIMMGSFSIQNAIVRDSAIPTTVGVTKSYTLASVNMKNADLGSAVAAYEVSGNASPFGLLATAQTSATIVVHDTGAEDQAFKGVTLKKNNANSSYSTISNVTAWAGDLVYFAFDGIANAQAQKMEQYTVVDSFDNTKMMLETVRLGSGYTSANTNVTITLGYSNGTPEQSFTVPVSQNTFSIIANATDYRGVNQVTIDYGEVPAGFKQSTTNRPGLAFRVTDNNTEDVPIVNKAQALVTYLNQPETSQVTTASVQFQAPQYAANVGTNKEAYNVTQGKKVSACNTVVGDIIRFTLKVPNNTGMTLRDIQIVDTYSNGLVSYPADGSVPAGQFIANVHPTNNTTAQDAGASLSDNSGLTVKSVADASNVLTMDFNNTFASGKTLAVSYTMKVVALDDGGNTLLTNKYTASARLASDPDGTGGGTGEPGTEPPRFMFSNGGYSFDAQTKAVPHISMEKTVVGDSTNLSIGSNVKYQVTLQNVLAVEDHQFIVKGFQDLLPKGFEYVPGTAKLALTKSGGSPTDVALGTVTVTPTSIIATSGQQTITMPISSTAGSSLAFEDTLTLTYEAKITDYITKDAGIAVTKNLTNTAYAYITDKVGDFFVKTGTGTADSGGGGYDNDTTTLSRISNTAAVTVLITGQYNVGLTKSTVPSAATSVDVTTEGNKTRTYSVAFTNYGSDAVSINAFVDFLPEFEKLADAGVITATGSNGSLVNISKNQSELDTENHTNSKVNDINNGKETFQKFTFDGFAGGAIVVPGNGGTVTFTYSTTLVPGPVRDKLNSMGATTSYKDNNYAAVFLDVQADSSVVPSAGSWITESDATGITGIAGSGGTWWSDGMGKRLQASISSTYSFTRIIPGVKIVPQKQSIVGMTESFTEYVPATHTIDPGDTVGWYVSFGNGSSTAMVKPAIYVVLPKGVKYEGEIETSAIWKFVDETVVDGQTILRYEVKDPDYSIANSKVDNSIKIRTTITGGMDAYTATAYIAPQSYQVFSHDASITYGANTLKADLDTGYFDAATLADNTTGLHMALHKGTVSAYGNFGLINSMTVQEVGNLSNQKTSAAPGAIELPSADSKAIFTYTVKNSGDQIYGDAVVVNRLPMIGDYATAAKSNESYNARKSTVGVIIDAESLKWDITDANGISIKDQYPNATIEFATVAPDQLLADSEWSTAGGSVTWGSAADTLADGPITAYRLCLDGDIPAGAKLTISYEGTFNQDELISADQVAYNAASIGFMVDNKILRAEPSPVGITTKAITPQITIKKDVVGTLRGNTTFYFKVDGYKNGIIVDAYKDQLVTITIPAGSTTGTTTLPGAVNGTMDYYKVTEVMDSSLTPIDATFDYKVTADNAGVIPVASNGTMSPITITNEVINELVITKTAPDVSSSAPNMRDFYFKVTGTGFAQQIVKVTTAQQSDGSLYGESIAIQVLAGVTDLVVTEVADSSGTEITTASFPYRAYVNQVPVPEELGNHNSMRYTFKAENTLPDSDKDVLIINKKVNVASGVTLANKDFYFWVYSTDYPPSYEALHKIKVAATNGIWEGTTGEIKLPTKGLNYKIQEVLYDGVTMTPVDASNFGYTPSGNETGMVSTKIVADKRVRTITFAWENDPIPGDQVLIKKVLNENTATPSSTKFLFTLKGTINGVERYSKENIAVNLLRTGNTWSGETLVVDIPGEYKGMQYELIEEGNTSYDFTWSTDNIPNGNTITINAVNNLKPPEDDVVTINKVLTETSIHPEDVDKSFTFLLTGYKNGVQEYGPIYHTVHVTHNGTNWTGTSGPIVISGKSGLTYQLQEVDEGLYALKYGYIVDYSKNEVTTNHTVAVFDVVNTKANDDNQDVSIVVNKVLNQNSAAPRNRYFYFTLRGYDSNNAVAHTANVTVEVFRDGTVWRGSTKSEDLPTGLTWTISENTGGLTGDYYVPVYSNIFWTGKGTSVVTGNVTVTNTPSTNGGGGGNSDGGGGGSNDFTTGTTDNGRNPFAPGGDTVTIGDDEIPLGAGPNLTTIFDDPIPLGKLPQTGGALIHLAGLAGMLMLAGSAALSKKSSKK